MAAKEMKTFTVGENTYEIVDEYARKQLENVDFDIKPLVLTGAVSAEYDGKQALTIEIPESAGMTPAQANSLWVILQKTAFTTQLTSAEISAFKTAWGISGTVTPDAPVDPSTTLISISVVYTGGDVATGTAVTDLTGITVTATYSDGITQTVTGYTLSGDIVEGENTITVSYGGKTTTFTVTGIVESGGDTTAELVTDGLLAYFDFRTAEYNNEGAGSTTLIQPTQGEGQLFAWEKNCITEQGEYGIKSGRSYNYSADGNTTQADLGTEFTIVELLYGQAGGDAFQTTNLDPRWQIRPVYNNTSGSTTNIEATSGGKLNGDASDDYNFTVYRVNGKDCTAMFDTSVMNYNGDDYEDFSSWVSSYRVGKTSFGHGYGVAAAFYNRALTDVEIEEMRAFMKTLEVA